MARMQKLAPLTPIWFLDILLTSFPSCMELMPEKVVILILAGALSAALNTLASSGSAVTLPLLEFMGLPAPMANGTNRISMFFGSITRILSFHRSGVLEWRPALLFSIPTFVGAILGALIGIKISVLQMKWAIDIALVVAFVLILVNPKRWIHSQAATQLRMGPRQWALFFLVGIWAGFIVLDSGTYLLLVLVLSVGCDLVRANAINRTALENGARGMFPTLSPERIAGRDIDAGAGHRSAPPDHQNHLRTGRL